MTLYTIDNRPRLLRKDDYVIFVIEGRNLKYCVNHTFLNGHGCGNDEVFKGLGMSRPQLDDFASLHYGYRSNGGCWPVCSSCDWPALTRLTNALFDLIEDKLLNPISKNICKGEFYTVLEWLAAGPILHPAFDVSPYITLLRGLKYKTRDGDKLSTTQLVKRVPGGWAAPDPDKIRYLMAKIKQEKVTLGLR